MAQAIKLGALLESGPGGRLELLTGPADLDRLVRTVHVWDESHTADSYENGLVFLVTTAADANPRLLSIARHCEAAGAMGLVLRGQVDPAWVGLMSARCSLTILSIPAEVPWDECFFHCRAMAAEGARGVSTLSTVLDAVAATAGTPALLEDRDFGLIGYSASSDWTDPTAVEQVLTGRAPATVTDWLRSSGALGRIAAASAPMTVQSPVFGQRVVVPVRGMFGLVGRIWLPGAQEPGPETAAVLTEQAGQIASILAAGARRERRADRPDAEHLLRAALSGGSASAFAEEIGCSPDQPLQLVGFRPLVPEGLAEGGLAVLGELLTAQAATQRRRCFVVQFSGALYTIARSADLPDEAALGLARTVIETYLRFSGREVACVVGTPTKPVSALAVARAEMDRSLRVSVARALAGPVHFEDLHTSTFFAELREHVTEHPQILSGPFRKIMELDAAGRTEYVSTLQAYFNANCDAGRAARDLFVHRNTLKYRLQRIQELAGLDLEDPLARCACEVQMRLVYDF